ncbi:MAG: carbon-nitrogen hydrolase family protein [Oscillospiraceae bacterium]|nr:carbon-nitrogen hydrolase family protein [Oscillospiraceae bacterium]
MEDRIIFEWESGNNIDNIDNGEKWRRWTPREKSAPAFGENPGGLKVTGRSTAIGGYETGNIPVTGGKTYRLDVEFKADNVGDINLNILNIIRGNIDPDDSKSSRNSMDGISDFKYTDNNKNIIAGTLTVKLSERLNSVSIMLGLRYSDGGTVEWSRVKLSETKPPPSRKAVVSVTKYNPQSLGSADNYISFTNKICGKAAACETDLLLFTEFANIYSANNKLEDLSEEISPESLTYKLISENAAKYKMYICTAIMEKRGDDLYNTAVIFGRNGELIGQYSKVHLYFPEEILDGTTPGDEHPVFDLDFGRIGVVICYDNWFAESYRILGLKGAELILLPNAGYGTRTLPARAIDNGVYIAVSSIHDPACVANTTGEILTEISGYNDCDVNKAFAPAEIDLSQKPLPHANSGGNLNGSSGGKRLMRHSRSSKLYEEILKEVKTWENKGSVYTWL